MWAAPKGQLEAPPPKPLLPQRQRRKPFSEVTFCHLLGLPARHPPHRRALLGGVAGPLGQQEPPGPHPLVFDLFHPSLHQPPLEGQPIHPIKGNVPVQQFVQKASQRSSLKNPRHPQPGRGFLKTSRLPAHTRAKRWLSLSQPPQSARPRCAAGRSAPGSPAAPSPPPRPP